MIFIEAFLGLLAAALLLPVSVVLFQALMALPRYRPRAMPRGRRPTLAVVVPAHDEETTIAGTLRAIRPQLVPGDRLLVVADNCSDDTASVASLAGAQVIERAEPGRRGKGYALDFGVRHLERDAPEVAVFVDADCDVSRGAIDRLARTCLESDRPVQALYLMRASGPVSLSARVAEFAWIVKNQVRPLGFRRVGLPCQLMGSGMAFPWQAIAQVRLASGQIVEDLVLGLELARAGRPPLFCPEAHITSAFACSPEGARTQRTRWEHGHLAAILGHAPQLLIEGVRRGNRNLVALVVDLCVPPLALLSALVLALLAASAVLYAATAFALPLWLAATSLAMLGVAVLAAWVRHGRGVISLGSLACAPVYALSKMPIYLKYLVKRQAEWVRTRRGVD